MSCWFKSDNTSGIAPQVLAAIADENSSAGTAYGEDVTTRALQDDLCALFERDVRAFPVATGTAANALALACITPRWGAVFAHEEAHVLRDESSAPEFFTAGARLVSVGGDQGRVDPRLLEAALTVVPASIHTVLPAALSVTQCTECGTCYRPEQLAALREVARRHGLRVHMDGARFANAVAALGVSPAELSWRAGIDVLSFGGTKNGAMGAEAVVCFDPALGAEFERHRKRGGHLLSKARFVSAQLRALLRDGLWLQLARRANGLAARIGAAARADLLYPVEANEVFLRLNPARIAALRAHPDGFLFYDWGPAGSGQARFVVSWNQPERDVERLLAALAATR